MSKNEISRKEFLKRISMVGVIGIGSTTLLEACSSGSKQKSSAESNMSSTKSESAAGSSTTTAADPCADLSGLTDAQKKMRETLKYTGKSPYPSKLCSNCQFYTKAPEGKKCGTCSIVAGPINPDGHCTSWVAKQS